MDKKKVNESWAASRKIRGSWGAISPITKIIPNKKKPKRTPKHKRRFDDEPSFV